MNDLAPFTFPDTGHEIRVVTIDDEPWWIATDICAALGYSNPSDAVATHVDAEDLTRATLALSEGSRIVNRERPLVNESGLYSLILRSNIPQARAFKRWVTHEVLPAIRKTGRYEVQLGDPLAELERQTHMTVKAIEVARQERAGREAAERQVRELEPAARAWDTLASAEGDFAVADAAKILSRDPAIKLGRDRLFTLLREWGWAFRQGVDGKHRAYQKAIDPGWLSEIPQSHYHPRTGELVLDPPQVRVTVKGLQALHKKLGGVAQLRIDINTAA